MKHTSLFMYYLLVLVLCLPLCILGASLTQVAERRPTRSGWVVHGEPHPLEPITFKVLLKQRNLPQLEKTFWEVSDPKHANYGKFLKKHEIENMIAPEPASVNRVLGWLGSAGVNEESMVVFSDYITITLPVHHAATLFATTFSVYKSTKLGETRTRISGPAHIPTDLSDDIDFVTGISELFGNNHFTASVHPKSKGNNSTTLSRAREANTDQPVTPSILSSYYKVPAGTVGTNTKNEIGIAAFDDYFSSGALTEFQTTFKLKPTTVVFNGPVCPYTAASCGQTESDLDVQYSTAMGSGVPTTFLSHKNGEWVLDWTQQLTALATPPLINSASYGFGETEQCEATTACQTYGYTSAQYVTRTDTQFQALGTRGLTILVSSGDDGAPAFFNGEGNCPMDPNVYCPKGGCAHTTTACPELTITKTGTTGACYYPMGIQADLSNCATFAVDKKFQTALTAFGTGNPTCNIAIEQDSAGNPQFYTTCACTALKPVTSSGYTVTAYTYSPTAAPTFQAMYPAASPYVTSVGATQFGWTGATPTSEGVAGILTGALITSGGGFSSQTKQPSYQTKAVSNWLTTGINRPPTTAFNSAMRAYPDIAFSGHFYVVFTSSSTTDMNACPCDTAAVDGTSCSSPALAGMLSLINDKLLNDGKSALGFLNPLLYQMAEESPAAFTDIVTGGNQCNRGYCCKYGYSASKGWDPSSGLGTPVYSAMETYILSAKSGAGAGSEAAADAGGGGSGSASLRAGVLALAVPAALLVSSFL